jgi:phage terminase large subunit-like protein
MGRLVAQLGDAASIADWDLSCPDWKVRLKEGRSLVPALPLFPGQGERAVAVLNKLRLADVVGTPTFADAGGEWFRDIVRAMFGSYDTVTKRRMISELFLLVPKKNSKTTNGALLMLTAVLLNERPRAPFLLTAPLQKTADEAFSAIAGAIELDPVLQAKLHVKDHLKTILHRQTGAKLEILTFDPKAITGKKVVGALIDELHLLGKINGADKAMLQLRGGMQPFAEAFLATITTQSDDAPAGVFKEDLLKAREVRDGKRKSPTLAVLYEFPQEMQTDPAQPWKDTKNWPLVTPNAGLSLDLGRLARAYHDEEEKGEAAMRLWASQHLNIEIGLALMSNAWAGAEHWESCRGKRLSLEEFIALCEVVTVGIDGGGLDDLLGLTLIGRPKAGGAWIWWTRAWAHKKVLLRRKDIAERLKDFEKQGDLVLVDKPGPDVDQVADIVVALNKAKLLPETNAIGVDPAGIGSIIAELTKAERGIDPKQIIGIKQGWTLNGAIKDTERKLAGGEIVQCDQPIMAWSVGNAKIEDRANSILVTKQASGKAKIDPLMAGFNAVSLMSLNPKGSAPKHQFFTIG